jgi:hypothetical protein
MLPYSGAGINYISCREKVILIIFKISKNGERVKISQQGIKTTNRGLRA